MSRLKSLTMNNYIAILFNAGFFEMKSLIAATGIDKG